MKRANESVYPPALDRTPVTTRYDPNTIQASIASPVLPVTHAHSQPNLASSANRTGTAMLQAAIPSVPFSPAPLPLQPAADCRAEVQGQRDIFQNWILCNHVKQKIDEGKRAWQTFANSLKGQKRTDFLIASFYGIALKFGSHAHWHGAVERIISELGIDVMLTQKWPWNMTLIHVLAHTKHIKWLNLALADDREKKMSLMLKTDCAVTPLEIAAVCGSKNVVRCILARETDADSLRMQASDSGRIALHAACMNNHVSVAKLLLERKGREQRLFANLEGKLPIHVAMLYGANIDFLPPLLAECAMEQTLAQTKSGMNALMLAAQAASSAAVDMLLAVPGSLAGQLQARDSTGSGAIDHARRSGNAEVIARIEAAMQTLHPVSSTFATRPAIDPGAHPGPVPLTPNPAGTDVADEFSLSDYEEILFKQ